MHGEVLTPEVVTGGTYAALLDAIGELLAKARSSIARHINTTLVRTYWGTGRHIVEYEQNGKDRAKYGANLMNNLVRDLRARYGRGFSKTNLIYMRKFYLVFRKSQTVSDLLSWSHYMELLRITDKLEMQFYCAECIHSNRNVRELHRSFVNENREILLETERTATATNVTGQRRQILERNSVNLFVAAHLGGTFQVHFQVARHHAYEVANLVSVNENRLENLVDVFAETVGDMLRTQVVFVNLVGDKLVRNFLAV